jgi:NAD(P)-dependent dehydrogenase (short-subunit alcohol dehydrogenase family)
MSTYKTPQKTEIKPQHQEHQPGREEEMRPAPEYEDLEYKGSEKLLNKVALITGGDSGIGRATAILFAKEKAKVAIVYLEEHEDARKTRSRIEELGSQCLNIPGDIRSEETCRQVVQKVIDKYGKLDILINNAGVQFPQDSLENISEDQLQRTFQTNIYSMFFLTKAALRYMKEGAAIVNNASITAYSGQKYLIDYASTKGAVISFTRSLALSLAEKGIRVNAVAPGPIWTPLIPSSFSDDYITSEFGGGPMDRVGQPREVAPCFLFLACNQFSSFMSGQTLHPNGGKVVNG